MNERIYRHLDRCFFLSLYLEIYSFDKILFNGLMRELDGQYDSYAGSLLVSHPNLVDPNFKRSLILISAHTEDKGAFGIVLNRPMGKCLADWSSDFRDTPLAEVPLYQGGPVSSEELIITVWKPDTLHPAFQLFFGVSPQKAAELKLDNPQVIIKAYAGYAGWGNGQLEDEVKSNAWVPADIPDNLFELIDTKSGWKTLFKQLRPHESFLADAPEDPLVN